MLLRTSFTKQKNYFFLYLKISVMGFNYKNKWSN